MAIFAIFIDSKTVSWAYDGIQAVRLFLSKYKRLFAMIFFKRLAVIPLKV